MTPPLNKMLGVKWMEMNYSLLHLTILHVRVLLNHKKNNSMRFKGILNPGPTPTTLEKFPNFAVILFGSCADANTKLNQFIHIALFIFSFLTTS